MKANIVYILLTTAVCVFTVFVYRQWSLTGSAVLIGFFLLVMFGAQRFLNSSEKKLEKMLAELSESQIIEALAILKNDSPKDRKEIVSYMEKHPEKYADILHELRRPLVGNPKRD